MKKASSTEIDEAFMKAWWPGSESNQRHKDFQSSALPTELPGQPKKEL